MTPAGQPDLSAIAEFNTFNRVFSSTAIALLYYDFLLTISLEVERYWTGRRSWASVFYFLNRYTVIVSHIPVIYEFFFVMSESWTIIWLHIMEIKNSAKEAVLAVGCDLTVSVSEGIRTDRSLSSLVIVQLIRGPVLAVSWSVMFIFDATVFVLTFSQAVCAYRMWSHSLATLMLKDGSIYFGVLGICYLLNIVSYVVRFDRYIQDAILAI
ncbi:hypothetical protein GSI_11837 [Ganoderma sinense ZZ0214-1]|uniref:DUF6533 domain-containing protein n=1 Tax=Ganoderma sinense ZZ0214-1 TaxID=1077348 RepID=A0A2G8RX37_9APHY|nr:hypothetical protein GSI_11837 [Ganoderma sinense ZZ0214-1]